MGSRKARGAAPARLPNVQTRQIARAHQDGDSDRGYSALEDLEDSDDEDDDKIVAYEERFHVSDYSHSTKDRGASYLSVPNTTGNSPEASEEGDEENDAEDEIDEDDEDDNDDDVEDDDDEDYDDGPQRAHGSGGVLRTPTEGRSRTSSGTKRQVRFNIPAKHSDSSDLDTDDDITDMFPDIFSMERHERPQERHGAFTDDYPGFDDPFAFANNDLLASTATATFSNRRGEPSDASEDESDAVSGECRLHLTLHLEAMLMKGFAAEGDTTDEDETVPMPMPRKKGPSSGLVETPNLSSDSESSRFNTRRRNTPRTHRISLDNKETPSKPVAVMHPLTRKLLIFTPTQRPNDLSLELSHLSPESASRIISARKSQEIKVREAAEAFLNQTLRKGPIPDDHYIPPNVADDGDGLALSGSASELDDNHPGFLSYYALPDSALHGGLFTITDASDVAYADLGVDIPLEIDTNLADEDMSFFFNLEEASEGERSSHHATAVDADPFTSEAESAVLEAEMLTFASDSDSNEGGTGLMGATPGQQLPTGSIGSPEHWRQKRKASEEPAADGHKRHRSITDFRAISLTSDT
jgi:hypothetical protein